MTGLLCRLGIHHPAFQPTVEHSWLQLRLCARCKVPIERPHR